MSIKDLEWKVLRFSSSIPPGSEAEAQEAFKEVIELLNQGEIRAAERDEDGKWQAKSWVRVGALLGFRIGQTIDHSKRGQLQFFDKDTFPLKRLTIADGVRLPPGGVSIRTGAYVAPGVVCMPPSYINVGAHIEQGTTIDSNVLIGACAQVGQRVRISAGAQLGDSLEPPAGLPVVIEDDVVIGGNCAVFAGTIVRERAVLAPGTILSITTPVFDLVNNVVHRSAPYQPLEIPAGAVVVPGTRPVSAASGKKHGISLYAPVLIKYRDDRTTTPARIHELLGSEG